MRPKSDPKSENKTYDHFTPISGQASARALWDQKKKLIVLARDRFGIKPLYYHFDGVELVFASEIKAIRALVKSEMNQNRIAEFLWSKPYKASETFYEGISQVMASHFLELDFSTKKAKCSKLLGTLKHRHVIQNHRPRRGNKKLL